MARYGSRGYFARRPGSLAYLMHLSVCILWVCSVVLIYGCRYEWKP